MKRAIKRLTSRYNFKPGHFPNTYFLGDRRSGPGSSNKRSQIVASHDLPLFVRHMDHLVVFGCGNQLWLASSVPRKGMPLAVRPILVSIREVPPLMFIDCKVFTFHQLSKLIPIVLGDLCQRGAERSTEFRINRRPFPYFHSVVKHLSMAINYLNVNSAAGGVRRNIYRSIPMDNRRYKESRFSVRSLRRQLRTSRSYSLHLLVKEKTLDSVAAKSLVETQAIRARQRVLDSQKLSVHFSTQEAIVGLRFWTLGRRAKLDSSSTSDVQEGFPALPDGNIRWLHWH